MTTLQNQPPAFFVRGPSPLARFVLFGVVSLALMVVDARLHYLAEVRQGFAVLLRPLEVIASSPLVAYYRVRAYFATQSSLIQQNAALRQQLLQQGVDLQRLQALDAENAHLRGLLGAVPAGEHTAQMAEIIHTSRDPFTHKVVVDRGAHHGVVAGQAAVDEHGVIGQVTRVYPFSSEVTLLTDRELAIPIQVERNGLRAIVFGHGRDHTIDLPYLPVNVDIREGDELVTSGIDGVYPSGLAVAKVTRIERNADSPFARIVCTPTAGIETHRQILLLAMPRSPAPEAPVTGKSISRPRHAPRKP